MKKVTSRMVAAAAGVSQSTVSKVINNSPEVAPETARHVIRTAQQMNYPLIPRNRQETVAVIIRPGEMSGYTASMLSALSNELLLRTLRIEIIFDHQLELLNERCFSGGVAISWDRELTRQWGEYFTVPLIRINGAADHSRNCWSISYDGESAMENLVETLYKLGHRNIGFFSYSSLQQELENIACRYQGFIHALRRRKLDESFVLFDIKAEAVEKLTAVLESWRRRKLTALIFPNELGNMLIDRVCRLLDIRIPEDMSLVCWEMKSGSEFFTPPHTTLSIMPQEVCKKAVDMLFDRIAARGQGTMADVYLPYRLIMRQSVGKAP